MVSTQEFERRTEQMKGDIVGAYKDIHEVKETVGRIEVRVQDMDEKIDILGRQTGRQADNIRRLENQAVEVRKTQAAHGERLDVQSALLERHGQRLDTMDGKLDKIIEVVGGGSSRTS